MRVFIVNSMCGSGSTGRIVSDTYNILKKLGHDVKIAYGLGQVSRVNRDDVIKVNNKFGYYTHNILSRITDKTGLYSKKQTRKLVNEIERFRPDIIQLHNLHGYWMNYKILFEYLLKVNIPVVWTLHDCWAFTGHCAHFDYCGCEKWVKQCRACPQLREYPMCYLSGNVINNYKLKKKLFSGVQNLTIVTPSQWLASLVKKSYLKSYPIKVINNGIDLNAFRSQFSNVRKHYSLETKIIVLSVANVWNEKKGYEDIQTLSELLSDNYQIIIVGLSEKQMQSIPKKIIGIQRTNSIHELAEIYSSADVFVNLTYEDTFPTVNIEALACGLPVVTYQTGGSPEILDKTCGVIVKKGDVNALPSAIKTAYGLKREDACERSHIFDKFDKYMEYVRLYEQILKRIKEGAE